MAISINTSSDIHLQTDTAQGIKTAGLAKNQIAVEGQMAINLIQSATTAIQSPNLSSNGTSGSIINIKV